MNQTTLELQTSLFTHPIGDPRRCQRYEMLSLFAITDRGTGKILNIGEDGMAFGCLYPHHFENTIYFDIIDSHGMHIKRIEGKKSWERHCNPTDRYTEYELEIGVEFVNLNDLQRFQLGKLLNQAQLNAL